MSMFKQQGMDPTQFLNSLGSSTPTSTTSPSTSLLSNTPVGLPTTPSGTSPAGLPTTPSGTSPAGLPTSSSGSGLPESQFGDKALLSQIARGEGTTDEKARKHGFESAYDVPLGYGAYGRPDKPLSQMTLGEVKEYQRRMLANPKNKWNSSAVGKYQIVGKTLRGLQDELGLSDDQIFDQQLQDRLGTQLLNRRGYAKWKRGEISDEEFQNNLAKEWASVARADTGKSHYGQHTGTSSSQIQQALKRAKMTREEAVQQGLITPEGPTVGSLDQPVDRSLLDSSTGFITGNNPIPESMKDMPIKLASGKVVPLSSTGATTFDEIQQDAGQAFAGGVNDPATTYATSHLLERLSEDPRFSDVRLTGQNDLFHQKRDRNKRVKSGHTKGYKVDIASASVADVDFVVSWNFKHVVNLNRIQG